MTPRTADRAAATRRLLHRHLRGPSRPAPVSGRDGGPGPAHRDGFTLLEVMAAVAIVGIWFVALASMSIDSLRVEGQSMRRLAAGLIAEEALSEIEGRLNAGEVPELGETEEEQDEFVVVTHVEPYELELAEAPGREGRIRGRGELGGQSATTSPSAFPNPLRSVRVEVRWSEGENERSVVRTTYGYDLASMQEALEQVEAEQQAASDAGGLSAEGDRAAEIEALREELLKQEESLR